MDSVFPFGFPIPTAGYLVLYVLTFVLHQAFMHYVLAGSFYLAGCTLFPGAGAISRSERPLANVLRDWMPFVLSAAITAGVAPLLFVQIVYPTAFYTANLLLSWRWVIVVPALIVVFYLLYLLKTRRFAQWTTAVRRTLSLFVAVSFVFVGFCWTANHLISMNESAWPEIYRTGDLELSSLEVLLRVLIWSGGAIPTMAVFASGQLALLSATNSSSGISEELARLAKWSLGGLTLSAISAAVYLCWMDEASRNLILGQFAFPYLIVAIAGLVLQAVAWGQVLRAGYRQLWLFVATLGCVFSILGVSVMREAIRLSHLDIAQLFANHEEAGNIGGLSVFLMFTLFNFGAIGLCVVLVRRGLRETSSAELSSND